MGGVACSHSHGQRGRKTSGPVLAPTLPGISQLVCCTHRSSESPPLSLHTRPPRTPQTQGVSGGRAGAMCAPGRGWGGPPAAARAAPGLLLADIVSTSGDWETLTQGKRGFRHDTEVSVRNSSRRGRLLSGPSSPLPALNGLGVSLRSHRVFSQNASPHVGMIQGSAVQVGRDGWGPAVLGTCYFCENAT